MTYMEKLKAEFPQKSLPMQPTKVTEGAFVGFVSAAPSSNSTARQLATRSEQRRQRVLALLDKSPTARIAVVTDDRAERDTVIVTIAIRAKGTCDVRIPRHKYDGPRLLDLIQKHATTVH